MKRKKTIIISAVIIFIVAITGYFCLSSRQLTKTEELLYSGYCPELGRYLTTQEKFDIVVTHIVDRERGYGREDQNALYPKEGWRKAYTVNEAGGKIRLNKDIATSFRYSSIEEFYEMNPNACELVEMFMNEGTMYDVPFEARVSGDLNILVRVFYIYDFDVVNNNQPIYREEYFGLSNCGQIWSERDIMVLHFPKLGW